MIGHIIRCIHDLLWICYYPIWLPSFVAALISHFLCHYYPLLDSAVTPIFHSRFISPRLRPLPSLFLLYLIHTNYRFKLPCHIRGSDYSSHCLTFRTLLALHVCPRSYALLCVSFSLARLKAGFRTPYVICSSRFFLVHRKPLK